MNPIDGHRYPALDRLVGAVLAVWPEHAGFLGNSFGEEDASGLAWAETVAGLIGRLAGDDLPRACGDYRWTCQRLLEEELHFRRNGTYRLTTFAEAEYAVYADADFMGRYVNGLLLSHLFWANHRRVLRFYDERFLPGKGDGFRHLEVGPGHGLLLYLAARRQACSRAAGWDVSATSARHARACLDRLGVSADVAVERRDLFSVHADGGTFDSIVASEVLEHLERPAEALAALRALLAPGGRLFVNMPVNSPAPDHIHLLRRPEEVFDLVGMNGFRVLETAVFPATGYDEARARRQEVTMSCVVIATPGP
ncbi:MAG: class I SAM-dependent methyltransferase [Magnetospirillum sp. WYHS-4]